MMDNKGTQERRLKKAWHKLQKLEGDKVILIIVLLLILISFLAIFSSTPLLPAQGSRLATMREHGMVAILGIGLITLLYRFDIKWIKYLSQAGFVLSFIMLTMLLLKVDLGFIKIKPFSGDPGYGIDHRQNMISVQQLSDGMNIIGHAGRRFTVDHRRQFEV